MGNRNLRTIPKAANSLQDECIRVPKVYDWVTATLTDTRTITLSERELEEIEFAMEDPSRRPLRIVVETPKTPPVFPLDRSGHEHKHHDDFMCDQIGEKRDVTVPINGEFANAQVVDLLFTAEIKIKVIDRHGVEVTCIETDATVLDSFVLCYPDGTDLLCRISKVFTRTPQGTILLNTPVSPTFDLDIVFCVDIQVEAEVKLEVLAKFCSPRENDIIAPTETEECPPVNFPAQCPSIFPRENCDCQASGEVSGVTGDQATEVGEASIFVDICPNCSLVNSRFEFIFEENDGAGADRTINFVATDFDQDSLSCQETNGGLKLFISGTGETESGRVLNFNLAVVDSTLGDQFQVQLVDPRHDRVIFDTHSVDVTEGMLTVEDCVTFNDIKFKKRP